MKLNFTELANKLKSAIDPIYIVSGNDDFLLLEYCDLIRKYLYQNNVTERLTFAVDSKFKWQEFFLQANNFSLFARKTLLELKFTDKPNALAVDALLTYGQNIPNDKILLLVAPKLDTTAINQPWFAALNKVGNFIPVQEVTNAQFLLWIKERLTEANLKLTQEALTFFCAALDGNLLAAKQEIEKLKLLPIAQTITLDNIHEISCCNAKFDIFALVDCVLSGNKVKILQALETLQQNNTEIILILWALARQIRTLITIKEAMDVAPDIKNILTKNGIWLARHNLVLNCLQKHTTKSLINLLALAYKIDCAIKGVENINLWNAITAFTFKLARV